jgi:hypothetical protein
VVEELKELLMVVYGDNGIDGMMIGFLKKWKRSVETSALA